MDNRLDPRSAKMAQELRQDPARRRTGFSKSSVFLVGLGSGAFIASHWRSVVKEGIKLAVKSGFKAQKVAARGAENLADLTREALADLRPTGIAGSTALPPASTPPTEASADAPAGTAG